MHNVNLIHASLQPELIHTYIDVSCNTWLGAEIAGHLVQSGHAGEPDIELDSIDAIEHLVALDFGVSVVPQRLLAPPLE